MTPADTLRHAPLERALVAAADSPLLLAMVGLTVVALFCLPTVRRLSSAFVRRLFRSHRPEPVGETTLNERLAVGAAVVLTLGMEASLLYSLSGAAVRPPLLAVGLLAAAAVAVMLFQLVGYWAVGFAFANAEQTRSWLHCFFISQAILSYLLVVPAFGALIYPQWLIFFLVLAGVAYVAARILFYIRAFGIFYTNLTSIFYFFLYLCTLEIVPLLVLLAASRLPELIS